MAWQLHIFDRVGLLFGFYSLIQVQFSGLECVVQFARKVHILAGNNPNPTLIISIFQHHHFAVAFSRQNLHHVSPRSASLLSVTRVIFLCLLGMVLQNITLQCTGTCRLQ